MDYKIACIIQKETYCTNYPPWYVSCYDIIPHTFLKTVFLSMSILVTGLNVLSIFVQLIKLHGSQINAIFKIKEIGHNLSGILCDLYLTGIWLSDILLEDMYLVNENLWESHPLCFTEFAVTLWFTISSQIILLYISGFRLMAVIEPTKTRQTAWELVFYQISMMDLFSVSIS